MRHKRFKLANLRCSCGSDQVVLVAPGRPRETAPGGFMVDRGQPIRATCMACWAVARGVTRTRSGEQTTLFVDR